MMHVVEGQTTTLKASPLSIYWAGLAIVAGYGDIVPHTYG